MIRLVRSHNYNDTCSALLLYHLAVVALSLTAAAFASAASDDRLTTFPLDHRPEGITNGPGSTLFVSQILSGKVLSIDALTGETKEIVGEQPQTPNARQAWGLAYYNDALFVAGGGSSYGGGTPQVYVYSATNGGVVATCDPLSLNTDFGSFMNDVIVIDGMAYVTDSFNNKLMVFDADVAIFSGECVVSEVTLPDVFLPNSGDDWGANGLVKYADGVLIVDEVGGSVYYNHILVDGNDSSYGYSQEVIPPGGAVSGDGLNVLEEKLYITRNFADTIDVFQLKKFATNTTPDSPLGFSITATLLGSITSPDYHTPATSALYEGYIYSANSYFASFEGDIAAPANNVVVGVPNMYAYDPNPQQTVRTERPCLAECQFQATCEEDCEVVCTTSEPPEVELCELVCEDTCQETEVCTFEVGRDELSSELGYFEFKGVNGDTCPGGTNPVLGIKKGATYLFTQRRTGNYYHPLGFAYGADGALDEQPELEPGICPGTVKGEEEFTFCDCQDTGLCPAPMYYTSNNYLGAYSNNPFLAPINGQSDDFGLDAYEPQFFYPLLQWKGTPREEDPTGPGYYQVALHFPVEEEYTGDFFYFCHIHQFMTGRLKFVNEDGLSINPDNTLRIPYEYQEPDAYDRSCGATGISESQLPDMECPTTFVCDAPDAAVAPFAAKFAECVDSMNCAMLKGITTKISSDSPIALFNHQMIPHHRQAVNMCKALDVAQGTQCDDIFDEDKPECVLKVLCQEIINVQNAQIATMFGILQQLELPFTDNCIVDIPVDPQTACEAQSGSTGYSWCVLTQTCVPPGDDACLEAECEENSIVTGKHWCALTQTCFMTGDQSCEKAYCELESGSTGFTWCDLLGTCVAPGDDACLEATCEENSASTGYHWCALTRTCFPPGDKECDKAHCEQVSGPSTGYSWCAVLEKCLPPSETCALPTGPPAPTDTPGDEPDDTFAPTVMVTFSPTLMPTRSSTSKSSKSSKSRRHTRQLKYE